ncbi:MAG: hypothetical protein ACREK1_12410, partial [Longimicrobiales bacterium]
MLLARERRLLQDGSRRNAYARSLASQTSSLEEQLLDHVDPALLAAAASAYVEQTALLSGVDAAIERTGAGVRSPAGYHSVELDVRGAGSLEHALRFIRRLEEGPRMAEVRSISMNAA